VTFHYRDYSTPVDEIMRGLHRHVLSGEILYPAVSDTPAWIVATANAYARQHGYSPFVLYQGLWNVSVRDVEREILRECLVRNVSSYAYISKADLNSNPLSLSDARSLAAMLRKEGMGFAPWGVIGQGKFMSKSQLEERKASNEPIRGGEQSEKDIKISEALAKIGDELGASVTAVALAWAFRKMPYVFPISE
jgi:aryl-alcohol dehydrogenase-like predicted oxidoreductase